MFDRYITTKILLLCLAGLASSQPAFGASDRTEETAPETVWICQSEFDLDAPRMPNPQFFGYGSTEREAVNDALQECEVLYPEWGCRLIEWQPCWEKNGEI